MRDQGTGHIRQRGKNSWRLKFDDGRAPSGKRIVRYVTFRGTKRQAQAELNRLLHSRNQGTYVDPTKMTVAEYLEHWLTVDIDRRVAAKTAERYRGMVRNQLIPRIGSVPLRKLTATHIEALEADLQRTGHVKGRRSGEGLTAQSVRHAHKILSQALTHAVRTEVLFRNPAQQVKPPRPPRHEIVILTKAECAALLQCAAHTPLHLLVLVGITTGMRRGELLALRWSDLDLKAGRLTVNQSMERVDGKITFKPPKTAGSRRTITLPAITVEGLIAHRATQATERLRLGLGKADLVFTRPDGEPMEASSITKGFGKLIKAAGVRRITLHGLRHTHISHQLIDGVHPKIVSERAGHANVSITLSVYAGFVPNMQADAAAGVDSWLRKELAEHVGAKSVPIPLFGDGGKPPSD
jgi:integrase